MSLKWFNRQLLDWHSFTRTAIMGLSTSTRTSNRSTLSFGKEYKKKGNLNGYVKSLIWATPDERSMTVLASTRLPAWVLENGSLRSFLTWSKWQDQAFSRFLSKVSSTFSISSKIENNRADNPSAVDNTSTYYPIKLPFNQNCDVWAMGGVIHFIFSGGQHPYGHSLTDRLSNIRKCKPTKSGRDFLAKISQPRFRVDLLVAEMIQEDPDQRPDMKTVLERIREWQPSKKYLSKYMNSSDNLFESFIVKFMAVAFIFTVVLLFILYILRL